MNILPSFWPIVAIVVSTTALLVALLNYRRKSSVRIRGGYTLTSSIECEDDFVSSVVVENQKDRTVSIYGIYLLIGHHYLVQLEEFDDGPLLLRPFETAAKTYGPIEFYGVQNRRIQLSNILNDRHVRKRLVLSTSDGRYVVRRFPKRWYPVRDHFRNHALALIRPIRSVYKEREIGSNVRYVLDLVLSDGKSEIILLTRSEWSMKRFKNFTLTKDSLESAEALRTFLAERRADGSLVCESITVFDADVWRQNERQFYSGDPIAPQLLDYFSYKVLGRLFTIARDRKLRRENARRLQSS